MRVRAGRPGASGLVREALGNEPSGDDARVDDDRTIGKFARSRHMSSRTCSSDPSSPPVVAGRGGAVAKTRKVSANRVPVDLIERCSSEERGGALFPSVDREIGASQRDAAEGPSPGRPGNRCSPAQLVKGRYRLLVDLHDGSAPRFIDVGFK